MRSAEESYSAAVERALAILETVAQRPHGMTHSEISRKLEIPKSTLTYLLRALEARGYLRREEGTGKYHLGLKVLALARASKPAPTSKRSPGLCSSGWSSAAA